MANMLKKKGISAIRRLGMNQCPAGMPAVEIDDQKTNKRETKNDIKVIGTRQEGLSQWLGSSRLVNSPELVNSPSELEKRC